MTDCNPHPDAPHGFDRTASHREDRYVCDCEGWEPPRCVVCRSACDESGLCDDHKYDEQRAASNVRQTGVVEHSGSDNDTNRTQITGCVDDSLRTRIAAAISGLDDWRGITDAGVLADAVIRELGLQQEWAQPDEYGMWLEYWDTKPSGYSQTRYITEWVGDE